MKFRTLISAFMLLVTVLSCKSTVSDENQDKNPSNEEVSTAIRVSAVCISEGLSVRAEPSKDGKWLSRLSLGEKVIYLGKSKVDSADKNKNEYHFVELSDGQQVWAYGYGLLIDAKPAVVVEKTAIYNRPDLVTRTQKELKIIEFVAIVKEKENWCEVISSGKKKKGWMEKSKLSEKQEDVAVAVMASKTVLDKGGEIIVDKLPEFLEEIPYKDSEVTLYLQNLLDEQVANAIEKGLEQTEGNIFMEDIDSTSI